MNLWQQFYGAILRRRRARAARNAPRLPRPVISIGNLHWGGGGKTPMVQATARFLRDQGERVVILSRGHKRASKGPVLVSRGDGAVVSVAESGDEPALHAQLSGVGVVVAERRFDGGKRALEELDCDLFLLDDGFSHVGLARDIEILLFPSADPLGGGKLLPSGRLREPLGFAELADAAVLTGVDRDSDAEAALSELRGALKQAVSPSHWQQPLFASRSSARLAADTPIQRALLVSAVARPESVFAAAQRLSQEHGFEVVSRLDFPDHHPYPDRTLRTINATADQLQADTVLVTSKDAVKLRQRPSLDSRLQLVEIDHRAEPESDYFEWLEQKIADLRAGAAELEAKRNLKR